MSRFRANLHSCARGAWRIGPRTAMPMDDTAGRVPPRRVGDPTGGAGGRGRGAAPGPSRPSRPTPVGSCASSSVPRRRAPSGTLRDRSMSGGQTSVARERAEREKSVASLMTRDKERLAEEVIELKRVNDDVATRLKLAQAELIRATGELRKRERALEALERGDDDGGAARRATRVLELEAENEVYLSEVARLASLLRLDPETGQLPGTSAGPSPDVPGADDEATPSNETGFRTASSAEVARLRAELAFGAKHAFESEMPHDLTTEHALTLADARATNAEARVASLERAAAEATDAWRTPPSRAPRASSARAAALASALAKAEEDRNHFRNLAAMEGRRGGGGGGGGHRGRGVRARAPRARLAAAADCRGRRRAERARESRGGGGARTANGGGSAVRRGRRGGRPPSDHFRARGGERTRAGGAAAGHAAPAGFVPRAAPPRSRRRTKSGAPPAPASRRRR